MIGYLYTITNKAGDSFKINDHVTDPQNVIALQAYPDMDVDVKNDEVDLDGQHGVWDFFSYFGKRNMSFSGVIVGESEANVEEMRNLIVRTLALPIQPSDEDDGYVTISWEDATGAEWSIQAKISRSPRFGRDMKQNYRLDFMLSFKSADPYILSGSDIEEDGLRGYFSYGVRFPIKLPAQMGLVGNNQLLIDNEGTAYAHTKIRVYGEAGGDVTNPTIENSSTGKSFTVETTLSGDDEWIEIDSKEGTVIDQDGTDVSALISDDSEFILLKPGENEIMYTANEDQRTPGGVVVVTFRNTSI